MHFSFPSFKNKAKTASTKKKLSNEIIIIMSTARAPTTTQSRDADQKHRATIFSYYTKKKSIINQKLRVRKFKTRITHASPIRRISQGLIFPRRASLVGLRMTRAYRFTYTTLIGIEKSFMQ